MIVELLSTSNLQSFNVRLADIIGLHEAIYLNALIEINEKAFRKKKVDENNFFTIDRDYIKSRTTISCKEQKQIEATLKELEILDLKEDNKIFIDFSTITSIMTNEDEDLNKDLTLIRAKKSKRTKSEAIIANLKNAIKTTNYELRQAYNAWIDGVYAKQGWMTKQAVITGEKLVDDFANHNLDTALEIINIAAINAYRDMQWAINYYNTHKKFEINKTQVVINKEVNLSAKGF